MKYVQFDVQDHLAAVTLNKPPVNALNLEMYGEITDTFRGINENSDVWAVLFRAEGRFFSAGNDVSDFSGVYDLAYIQKIDAAIQSVFACKVPVVAAVQGAAIGGGFTMVSACDIVVAAEKTKFSIPEARLGKVGGSAGASFSLPQKVVRYMALTGDTLLAEELAPYGFIRKIVPREELDATAYSIARKILANPPLSVRYTKESLNRVYEEAAQLKKIPLDHQVSLKIADTEDSKEALRAFAEKRAPKYMGR